MRSTFTATMLLAAALSAHATVTTRSNPPQGLEDSIRATTDLIDQGLGHIRDNDPAAARASFDQAIHSGAFAFLPQDQQYRALALAGLLAFDRKDYAQAHELLERATGFSGANENVWQARFEAAFNIRDFRDGAKCLTVMSSRWPATVERLNPGTVFQVELGIKGTNPGLERDYLQALFDMGWDDHTGGTDTLWHDLALLWLETGNAQKAAAVAARIGSVRTKLSMRIDKRFDNITRADPAAYDIDRIVLENLSKAKAAVAAAPNELKPVCTLQEQLIDSHHYTEAVAAADAVIAKTGNGSDPSAYSDFDQFYNWVLDNRARALARMGRWDDAITQWRHAARRPENGVMNVSQAINLAGLYARLRRPDDALDMMVGIGDMSPYGRMQYEKVQLEVAIEQNDKAATAKHLSYLREHRTDAIAAWQTALLLTGDLDGASDLLVERLNNARWRGDALVDMQQYLDITETPLGAELGQRWDEIQARPAVQKALAKVGRVEHFNLDPP